MVVTYYINVTIAYTKIPSSDKWFKNETFIYK